MDRPARAQGTLRGPRMLAGLLMAVALAGLGSVVGSGGCAVNRSRPSAGVDRRASLEARVRELRGQIQDNATQLGLPRAAGAGFPADVAPLDGSASGDPTPRTSMPPSPSVSPTPMVRGSRCERVCDLAEAICQDADEICRIADELEDDASKQACEDSQTSCRAAQQRCRNCR